MSGPFGAGALQFFGGADDFYSHTIGQSLRFEDGDSPSLSRTPSSTGNQRTWTWSGWIKRGTIDTTNSQYLFSAYGSGTNYTALSIGYSSDDDIFRFEAYDGGANLDSDFRSVRVLRDVSSWYHIVLAVDTTQSTSSNRVKIYINGDLQTSYTTQTFMAQNFDTAANSGVSHQVGSINSGYHFDGYMAEVNFIDGSALDPTSFGETKAGIWIPKDTSGLTFGTNGFRLKFQDSSALGDDTSGNGNDFSSSGLAATDVVLDSPTNNFATLNPLYTGSASATFSEGNLKNVTPSSGYGTAIATIVPQSGKYYAEFIGANILGIRDVTLSAANTTSLTAGSTKCIGYFTDGRVFTNGTTVLTTVDSFSTTDVVGITIDYDNSEVKWYVNNTLKVTRSSLDLTNVTFAVGDFGNTVTSTILCNFGQDSVNVSSANSDENGIGTFEYAPPSGFLALCSDNLPDPGIDPAQDEEPADYFNTVLYTGNSGTNAITGVGFQPDFVWLKSRAGTNAADSHRLNDSVRGANKQLYSNGANIEGTATNELTSFDSDGFTLGNASQVNDNTGPNTYVAWNWLAGGSASSNSNGSITSSVSANTKAGFSIVSYTGNATAGATVGHGLSSTPDLYIVKSRSLATSWVTYHKNAAASPEDGYLVLNDDDAFFDTVVWNDTAPTSSVFSLGGTGYSSNNSGATYIAYCFHGVEGYSKFGSYISTNSTAGPYVYTGFRPAWVMVKAASTGGSNYNWTIYDNKRSTINPISLQLEADQTSTDESTRGVPIDFLSNGFKLRNSYSEANGGSAVTYIYLAFADQPFKYSNAR